MEHTISSGNAPQPELWLPPGGMSVVLRLEEGNASKGRVDHWLMARGSQVLAVQAVRRHCRPGSAEQGCCEL